MRIIKNAQSVSISSQSAFFYVWDFPICIFLYVGFPVLYLFLPNLQRFIAQFAFFSPREPLLISVLRALYKYNKYLKRRKASPQGWGIIPQPGGERRREKRARDKPERRLSSRVLPGRVHGKP